MNYRKEVDKFHRIDDYYAESSKKILEEIEEYDLSYLVNVRADELADYFLAKYGLPKIEMGQPTYDISNPTPGKQEFDMELHFPVRIAPKIEFVLEGKDIFSGKSFYLTEEQFVTYVHIRSSDPAADEKIRKSIENVQKTIWFKNTNIEIGNRELRDHIVKIINEIQDNNRVIEKLLKKIPVKLEPKKGAKLPIVNFNVKQSVQAILPKAMTEQPFIESDKMMMLIGYLRNAAIGFETTPSVYSRLCEEDLRDILLGILNAIYEGDATGETFSKRGKTDIYLRIIPSSGILVMECKVWEGESLYKKTIDQLFRYLTWRHNNGILVTFNKNNQDFSRIVETAKITTTNHSSFVKDSLNVRDDSYFITRHIHPDDGNKVLELHHLLFNLFNPVK